MLSAEVSTKPFLILHVDVNKTIVPTDIAGGKSLSDVLNNVIAECCWGTVDRVAKTWTVSACRSVYLLISLQCAQEILSAKPLASDLTTYTQFIVCVVVSHFVRSLH